MFVRWCHVSWVCGFVRAMRMSRAIATISDCTQLTPSGALLYHAGMPEIARFLGIVIGIFPREHPPAHFHAVYGEYTITVEIEGGIVHGDFPKRALRLVLEWLDLHRDELLADWELVQSGRPARKIAPLE